jgi:hypothetical protein
MCSKALKISELLANGGMRERERLREREREREGGYPGRKRGINKCFCAFISHNRRATRRRQFCRPVCFFFFESFGQEVSEIGNLGLAAFCFKK